MKNLRKLFSVTTLILTMFLVVLLWFWTSEKLVKAIAILAVADFITGIVKYYNRKELNSEKMFKGICKKFYMFVIILLSETLEFYYNIPVFKITVSFYAANESLSILENCAEYIPIPDTLKERLEQVRGGATNADK